MKPRLPVEIEATLTKDVLRRIYSYVPNYAKQSPKKTMSPNFYRDIRSIQSSSLQGKNEMYMRDLEDFLL